MGPNRELWRAVKGWECYYEVSDWGRVRTVPRPILTRWGTPRATKRRFVRPQLHYSGYVQVGLCIKTRVYSHRVHRLVAQAFIPNPEGKPHIHHRDTDKTNNIRENLEWVTMQENNDYNTKLDVWVKGSAHHCSKLTEEDIPVIRRRLANGEYQYKIAADYGVTQHVIGMIHLGTAWKHVPYFSTPRLSGEDGERMREVKKRDVRRKGR